ncbi:MAG: hypothetical protein ACOX1G_01660 [bacterium]
MQKTPGAGGSSQGYRRIQMVQLGISWYGRESVLGVCQASRRFAKILKEDKALQEKVQKVKEAAGLSIVYCLLL